MFWIYILHYIEKKQTLFDWQSFALIEKAATVLFAKITLQICDQWTTAVMDYETFCWLPRPGKNQTGK